MTSLLVRLLYEIRSVEVFEYSWIPDACPCVEHHRATELYMDTKNAR